jgi:hypothetical protein
MTRGSRLGLLAALVAASVLACGTQEPTVAPTGVEQPAGVAISCVTIPEAECGVEAKMVLAGLPPGVPQPFDVQIVLGGCPNAAPCPRTIAARGGMAYVEFVGGVDTLTYSLGGDIGILGPLDFSFTDPISPTSARVGGGAPVPFQLGHCGLSWQVDFDGSFWVPFGELDGNAPGYINSESGRMQLLAPAVAQYTGEAGFTARLLRFPGPKRIFVCD